MKFGKWLQDHIVPAWRSKYIDYGELEVMIKKIGAAYEAHFESGGKRSSQDAIEENDINRRKSILLQRVLSPNDLLSQNANKECSGFG